MAVRAKLDLQISSNNEGMQDDPQERLSEILFDIAFSVKEAADIEGGAIRDQQGNTIGAWSLCIEDEVSLGKAG